MDSNIINSQYFSMDKWMFKWYLFSLFLITACNDKSSEQVETAVSKEENRVQVEKSKNIIFFGNSLTAGYGLDPSEAFPARIQDRIDSLNLPYNVVNAGVSGETSAGGNSRVQWILQQQPVDIFVLELGANDGLRGLPVDQTKKNLQAIIDKVKKTYPEAQIILAGMQLPPSLGLEYSASFGRVFPDLAKENNIPLIPFILEGVGGEASLNLQDGIHPTAEGHRILAENVWRELQKVL
jgi:acyl-CoA thioesterase I